MHTKYLFCWLGSSLGTGVVSRPRVSGGPMSVTGKVVVVTGAGSGLGAETAAVLAAAGARVVLCDRDEAAGRRRLEAIEQAGGDAAFVAADVSREDDVRRLVDETVRLFGRLDAAVNNAAVSPDTHPLD